MLSGNVSGQRGGFKFFRFCGRFRWFRLCFCLWRLLFFRCNFDGGFSFGRFLAGLENIGNGGAHRHLIAGLERYLAQNTGSLSIKFKRGFFTLNLQDNFTLFHTVALFFQPPDDFAAGHCLIKLGEDYGHSHADTSTRLNRNILIFYFPIISRAAALIFAGLTSIYCSCPGLKETGESSEATRLIGASR